jgi:hypothetical protein
MAATASGSSPFFVVCELGPGNFDVARFDGEDAARKQAASYWACWVLFKRDRSGELTELATGGVGLSVTRESIRSYAQLELNPLTCGLTFSNSPSRPIGEADVAPPSRVTFGIVYPAGLGVRSVYMHFDRTRPVEQVVAGAARHAGLVLEKGKLQGSPERLNLFTLEGDIVRLDLEVDAHLGSTLHPNAVLVLEKGNRVAASRLEAIRRLVVGG